ncbi:MAG: RNA methyltransferase [Acidobacteriota bacterium]|nr:RNA methyltransferase [Acidobacteriota bacterium]
MEASTLLDRIVVVLVRARNPNNIGAAARAMHDFGFRNLRIANDYPVPFETARSAIDASEVLARARIFPDAGSALADCDLVIGTTAVGERALEHPLYPLPAAATLIHQHLGSATGPDRNDTRVALLFGSEKTGLNNEELSHCHWLLTIPMQFQHDLRHPSMNLGQAVAVCLYELVRAASPVVATTDPEPGRANSGELERLTTLFTEVLEQTGYTRRHPANCAPAQIRRLILRMNLSAADLPIWLGILRQVLWRLQQPGAHDR